MAALAASQRTNWCLRSCCLPKTGVYKEAPTNQLDLDLLGPGRGGFVSVIHWCGIGEEDDNEKKWEVLRIILLGSCQNGIISCQHLCYTQDESWCA